jgi:hypothetical protein
MNTTQTGTIHGVLAGAYSGRRFDGTDAKAMLTHWVREGWAKASVDAKAPCGQQVERLCDLESLETIPSCYRCACAFAKAHGLPRPAKPVEVKFDEAALKAEFADLATTIARKIEIARTLAKKGERSMRIVWNFRARRLNGEE